MLDRDEDSGKLPRMAANGMLDEQVHPNEAVPPMLVGIGEHIGWNAGAHQLLQPTWSSSSASGAGLALFVASSLTLDD